MDDLAGSRMLLPQLLVLGDWNRAEMASIKTWVESLGASASVRHRLEMTPRDEFAEHDSASPDMVVVCQSWSDEFSASEVATCLGCWPLALWVCCFGCWCESDGRTRTIWPIGIRVPARAALARLNRLWAIVTGRLQEPLPVTASRDEAFGFDATFLAEPVTEAIDVSGAVISVYSPDPALKAWLSNLAIALGASRSDSSTDASAENWIVLWDVDPDWPRAVIEIKDFIAQHDGVRVIAAAGLPHSEVKMLLQAVGVEEVITKAYATSQLAGLMAARSGELQK
ncbi:MAG: hypothetical protein NT013_18795 [Planctomycetia bacterium]|nr:hypothetical protein [Planctomycetia bacterium]